MDSTISKGKNYSKLGICLEYVVYLFFRLVEEAICLIPGHGRALAFGRFCGRLMFGLARERRDVAVGNLTIAFGEERPPDEIRLLARRNFEHLGMLGVEFFRLRRWSHDELAERLVIEGSESFNQACFPGKKGVFLVTAHIGSFEVLAAVSRFLGIRGNLVVTGVPNRFVNRRMIFSRGGDESGLTTLPHRGIVHRCIQALRSGEMVVVLADQRGDDTRPIWVDFFGRKVLANGVFARFAVEGNVPVIPLMGLRLEDGRYVCEFGEEIPIEVSGDLERDMAAVSQRFHNIFEKWLREHPEQGFWMHRKFGRKRKARAETEAPLVGAPTSGRPSPPSRAGWRGG